MNTLDELAAKYGDVFWAKIPDYDSFDDEFNSAVREGVKLVKCFDRYYCPSLSEASDHDVIFGSQETWGRVWVGIGPDKGS